MRTLFIDFDGTICHDKFWRGLDDASSMLVQKTVFINNSLAVEWMCGKHTFEEINQFVSQETDIEYKMLWDVLVNDCKTMAVDHELLKQIDQLRQKFHIVLITGNMDCFDRFTVPSLRLHDHFDVIVNSFNEGQLKYDRNGETFLKYIVGNFDDAILIENSTAACNVFRKLGGMALQVTETVSAHHYIKNLL